MHVRWLDACPLGGLMISSEVSFNGTTVTMCLCVRSMFFPKKKKTSLPDYYEFVKSICQIRLVVIVIRDLITYFTSKV